MHGAQSTQNSILKRSDHPSQCPHAYGAAAWVRRVQPQTHTAVGLVKLLWRVVPFVVMPMRLALTVPVLSAVSMIPRVPPSENNGAIFPRAVKDPEPHNGAQRDANVLVRGVYMRRVEVCARK